jgi:septum site-determining protein MinC
MAAVPAAPTIPPEPVAETVAETVAEPVAELGLASAPDRAAPPDSPPDSPQSRPESNQSLQVRFKTENGKLLLILPPEISGADGSSTLAYSWSEVIQQLKQRLTAEARGWKAQTGVHLVSRDRTLDASQLQDLAETLETVQLKLRRIYTSRRQTAIAAATAGYSVEQHVAVSSLAPAAAAGLSMAEPLVLRTTLRSGADIRHGGTVVLIGDLNPGGSIVAEGDIVVWGRLRGTAHAGSKGNGQARIMALQMEPAQIRIAGFVARGPANPPAEFFPEVAYVTPQGRISIARVSELAKKG